MGLDGHVQCNCIKEGKIKTPPFDLNLIKYENNIYDISEDVDDKTFYSFLKWKENACKHRGLYYVSERVSNISGSNFLWSAISKAGEENFPILKTIWGTDYLKPEKAKEALQEVEFLKSKINEMEGVFLIDKATKEEYWAVFEDEEGWFYSHGREFNYKLSNKGFFITDSEDKELFLSRNFIQDVTMIRNLNKVQYKVIFKDIQEGKIYESVKPIDKCINWEKNEYYFPKGLEVIKRKLEVKDFYSLEILTRLFEASCETGNSVVWT
jgi:hypothetical protein